MGADARCAPADALLLPLRPRCTWLRRTASPRSRTRRGGSEHAAAWSSSSRGGGTLRCIQSLAQVVPAGGAPTQKATCWSRRCPTRRRKRAGAAAQQRKRALDTRSLPHCCYRCVRVVHGAIGPPRRAFVRSRAAQPQGPPRDIVSAGGTCTRSKWTLARKARRPGLAWSPATPGA